MKKIVNTLVFNKNVSRILAKTLLVKKLLLIGMLCSFALQTFSYTPGASRGTEITNTLPGKLDAMTIQAFLKLTPKKYYEITGKRMTLKQKLAFVILKNKLKKQLAEDKPAKYKTDLGLLSLIFGGGAWLLALIPGVGILSLGLAPAALILGILALGRKKGDAKAIIGIVLGSLFIALIAIALASIALWAWN